MFGDLIIGFDGSAPARDALALGRRLALDTNARPAVVYVRPHRALAGEPVDDAVDRIRDEARAALADVPGASFQCAPGPSVARGLQVAAEDRDAALIVVGATHRCGPGRVVPGATADAVIHGARCPVAIAPAGYALRAGRQPFGLIAAAVDAGADTERIAGVAGRIAARADATLRLITVADTAGVPGGAMAAGTIGFVTQANASRDCASTALDRATAAAGADVIVERRVAGGRVAGAVAKLSERADLLVIGSRAYVPVLRVLAGTHTGSIVHAASVPVLVLPQGTGDEVDEQVVPLAAAAAR